MDKKPIDSEIVRKFKIITEYQGFTSSASKTLKATFDLINRLQAENERLKEENKNLAIVDYFQWEKDLKAEAYKEFAEKVENKILPMLTTATLEEKETVCFCLDKIKNLLKEMVGEDNG